MHNMWTIAIDVPGVWQSVCSVALGDFAVNGLRSCLRWRLLWAQTLRKLC